MKQQKINQMRQCSHLLPPPGGEVVCELLDEIEKLQVKDTGQFCQVSDIKLRKAFIIPEVGKVYVRCDSSSDCIKCIQVHPYIGMVVLNGDTRVRRVKLDIKWSFA